MPARATPSSLPELMSTEEVAQLFNRAPRTIRSWVEKGHLTPRRVGGAVFFLREDVLALLGVAPRPAGDDE